LENRWARSGKQKEALRTDDVVLKGRPNIKTGGLRKRGRNKKKNGTKK